MVPLLPGPASGDKKQGRGLGDPARRTPGRARRAVRRRPTWPGTGSRPPAPKSGRAPAGSAYAFASADGAMRYSLLLLAEGDKVYGLYAQGEAAGFERHAGCRRGDGEEPHPGAARVLRARERSRRSASRCGCPPRGGRRGGSRAAAPCSCSTRARPSLADRGGQTAHASLTLTVEPLGVGRALEPFYQSSRPKLGDAFQVLSHGPLGRERLRGRDALRDARSRSPA